MIAYKYGFVGSKALKFATFFWFGVAVETFVPLVLPPIGSAAILGAGAAGFGGGGAEATVFVGGKHLLELLKM